MLLRRSPRRPPECKFEIASETSRQLRYAIKLFSHDLGGTVLLIDAINWMEIYFTGLPQDNCSILRHIIEESIKRCAEILSYDESAVEFHLGLPCPHNHSKHGIRKHAHHPAYIKPSSHHVIATCSIMKELPPVELTEARYVMWFEEFTSTRVDMPPLPHSLGTRPINDYVPHAIGKFFTVICTVDCGLQKSCNDRSVQTTQNHNFCHL